MTRALAIALCAAIGAASFAAAQVGQFVRHSACPTLGCIFPPDRANFLAGAKFDVRVEVHAENGATANPDFTLTIEKMEKIDKNQRKNLQRRAQGGAIDFSQYTKVQSSGLERWNFTYVKDAKTHWQKMDGVVGVDTQVDVAATAWRQVQLKEPGDYKVVLTYNDGLQTTTTEAVWHVSAIERQHRAKNVILFIGDGMTTSMITAARVMSKRQINGIYQTHLHLDQFPNLGHIMTHSLASMITDSANSASAYNSGHKSAPSALGVYPDTSSSTLDDPRVELIAELLRRRPAAQGGRGGVGIVTTAAVQDATPAAVFSHTRLRDNMDVITDQMIHGTDPVVADVYLGGGGEFFHARQGGRALNGTDYYEAYKSEHGYTVVNDREGLLSYNGAGPLLGIFHHGNMDVWLDRNVYRDNLNNPLNDPQGMGKPPLRQPNLDEMVVQALEVLERGYHEPGWFLMAEAASIDAMMHPLDYDRGLADLLELDMTVGKTLAWLKQRGLDKDTLVIVTADHGHSFDVYGSVDTEYLNSVATSGGGQEGQPEDAPDLGKRNAIGTYAHSGWPSYEDKDGDGFPDEWKVRFTLAAGVVAAPAHHEQFQVHMHGRHPAVGMTGSHHVYTVHVPNPDEDQNGMYRSGTLPVSESASVHSMQDVPVFTQGPGSELFRGVIDNTQVFHNIAAVLGLGEQEGGDGGESSSDQDKRQQLLNAVLAGGSS
ncbi:hypothetical protein BGZ73_005829 [Actinomortierella ambigua]|nr:hypothetical protein BGZ73_005829 [Actinomortierella ambigua]